MKIPSLGLEVAVNYAGKDIDRNIDIDSIRLIRKGRVEDIPNSSLLELHPNPPPRIPDEHPLCISEDYAKQWGLEDGDHYAMVEYKNPGGTRKISVWKVTGVLT